LGGGQGKTQETKSYVSRGPIAGGGVKSEWVTRGEKGGRPLGGGTQGVRGGTEKKSTMAPGEGEKKKGTTKCGYGSDRTYRNVKNATAEVPGSGEAAHD